MNREFLKKYWEHPRWHSLIVLLIWIIALALLMGMVSLLDIINPPKQVIKEEVKEIDVLTYEEKWDNLLVNDYDFVYTITKNNESVKYSGSVTNNITTGYRERKDGIIKYSIENGVVYERVLEEKRELTDLYELEDEVFLNVTSLIELIKSIPPVDTDIIEEKESTTYEYNTIVNQIDTKIKVVENDKEINYVLITQNEKNIEIAFEMK